MSRFLQFISLLAVMAPSCSVFADEWSGDGSKAGDRKTLTIQGVEFPFRWCPAGKFMMGSPEGELDRDSDETQHSVTLSKGFWLLETEVTQAMWESVMGENPSSFKGKKLPVESVSWDDCQEFITKLNEMSRELGSRASGMKFSLPTEAQWEYACRARRRHLISATIGEGWNSMLGTAGMRITTCG